MSNQQILDEGLAAKLDYQRSYRRGKDRFRSLLPIHAPCPQLCSEIVAAKGFHFTCLTCQKRKFEFKKRGFEKLSKRQTLVLVMQSASGKGFILPKSFDSYGLIIPRGINRFRRQAIKMLMTLAERIAEA
jgi:hypothetical protein